MPGEVLEIHTPDPQKLLIELSEIFNNDSSTTSKAELYGSMIHKITPQSDKTIKQINRMAKSANIKINSMTVVEPSLEDVFIASMQVN